MARRSLRPQLNQIRAWVRQGRTDAWIAHQLEISASELREFRRQHDLNASDDDPSTSEIDLRDEIEAEIEAATAEEADEAPESDADGSDGDSSDEEGDDDEQETQEAGAAAASSDDSDSDDSGEDTDDTSEDSGETDEASAAQVVDEAAAPVGDENEGEKAGEAGQ